MFFRIITAIIIFNSFLFSTIKTSNYFGVTTTKTNPQAQKLLAETFAEMVLAEETQLDTKGRETIVRFSSFIFEKLIPEAIVKVEFSENDPTEFTIHFPHSHIGTIPKVEKGAEAGFKSINFKVTQKLKGYFSPHDNSIYLEKNNYSGKHSFFKTQYSLNRVQFHVKGNKPTDISLETDLGAATKMWQENELIATFKHMNWKKG